PIVGPRALLLLLASAGILFGAMALVISARSDVYSLSKPQWQPSCTGHGGWAIWLPYGIVIAHVALVFPVLEVAMVMIHNRHSVRADILACMVLSQMATVAYVIWTTLLGGLRDYLSELFVVWVAALATNISSLRTEFNQVMEDRTRSEEFLAFSTRFYRSELPSFLSDYHLLKCKVLEVLMENQQQQQVPGAADHGPGTECSNTGAEVPAPQCMQRPPASTAAKSGDLLNRHPLAADVPVTIGIFEAVATLLPHVAVDKKTQFPGAVKSAFSAFVHAHLACGPNSTLGIPAEIASEVQAAVEQSNVVLSVLDRAKDEALLLLCTNEFLGYCRWLETQGCSARQ
ncbi:hypothetical protein LPJ61_002258, partial [Coemansia biformis]